MKQDKTKKKQPKLVQTKSLKKHTRSLKETGIIRKIEKDGVKILGNGSIEKKLTIKANKFTKSAAEKIEAAGGKAEVI